MKKIIILVYSIAFVKMPFVILNKTQITVLKLPNALAALDIEQLHALINIMKR